MTLDRRSLVILGVGLCGLVAVVPALAASPEPSGTGAPTASVAPSLEPVASPSPTGTPAPPATTATQAPVSLAPSVAPASPDTEKSGTSPDAKPKHDKADEVPVTVTGVVTSTVDADGDPTFALTSAGTTWELSAGPPWYWGDKNPLKASVGKSVTVTGSQEAGKNEIDVGTVDGVAVRAGGKPPWAGGPWVVGKIHPGWKDWMADGKPGKGHGHGQAKDKSAAGGPDDRGEDDASGD